MYDLKGSKQNRENKSSQIDPNICRKDLNFDKEIGQLDITETKRFIDNIKYDTEFFEDLNIMDYSLLLLRLEFTNETYKNYEMFVNSPDYENYRRYIFVSKSKKLVVYVLMIIDYLQVYHFFKFLENNIKVHIIERPENYDEISCVDPVTYSKRFYKYMNKIKGERDKLLTADSKEDLTIQ
jgi:hypothetical protein